MRFQFDRSKLSFYLPSTSSQQPESSPVLQMMYSHRLLLSFSLSWLQTARLVWSPLEPHEYEEVLKLIMAATFLPVFCFGFGHFSCVRFQVRTGGVVFMWPHLRCYSLFYAFFLPLSFVFIQHLKQF